MINCNEYVFEDVTGSDTDRTMSNSAGGYWQHSPQVKTSGYKCVANAQTAAIAVSDPNPPRTEHDRRVTKHTDAVAERIRICNVAATEGES